MNGTLKLGLIAAGLSVALLATRGSKWQPPEKAAQYIDAIRQAERTHGLPHNLLARLLYQESRYRDDIIEGRLKSSAGAVGIAQFLPGTAQEMGVDLFDGDPLDDIDGAARYLRRWFDYFGKWPLALAAYNWGPGNVRRAVETGMPMTQWPTETQKYVTEIMSDAGLV